MKPIQKLISLILTLLIIFNIVQPSTVKAANHILAKDHPNVQAVPEGTEANSDYSFSIKYTENTRGEIWGYNGKIIQGPHKGSLYILPEDNNLSGKIGHWLYNVGSYKGHNIDVKCTYYWKPYYVNGEPIYPMCGFSFANDFLWDHFYQRTYEIKYEFYSEGKPIKLSLSVCLGDIDGFQYYGLKSDGLVSVQCIDYCSAYYKEQDNWSWVYADSHVSTNVIQDTLRFELKEVYEFTLLVGTWQDSCLYNLEVLKESPNDDSILSAYKKNERVFR